MTPSELRRRADDLDRQGEAKLATGAKDEAAALFTAAESHREVADEMDRLRRRDQRGNPKGMVNAARVRMSAGADKNPDELVAKANAAGYTLRSLAETVKLSHSVMSMARRGRRSIRRAVAEDIERLTGFKAIKANWPGGIRD